ncbi:MAG: flagellar export protein FliJ [bacterium]|jgi:flagellar FliJ protein|nr:flagellar export protein FliJ [bacterium]
MPRFEFRFDTILRTRKTKEDHEKTILASRMSELRQEEEALNALDRKLNNLMDEMDTWNNQERIDPQLFLEYHRYFGWLKGMIAEQKELVRQAIDRVEQQKSVVVDAMKSRQIMEKLEERDFKKWRLEMERELQKTMDEIATQKFFKERKE